MYSNQICMSMVYLPLAALLVIISACPNLFAQSDKRTLPGNINQPSVNLYAPALSGNGQSIVYLSDYSDDGYHTMYFSVKRSISSWNDPVEVNKYVNNPKLNYRGGYSLSFDGDLLLVTSRKSGLGGFDLWYSEKNGSDWGSLKNFGKPINSESHEGAASLSADGQRLFFMRCDRMDTYKGASGCALFESKIKYGRWDDPVKLPSHINTGNSQNPQLLADGETLIFSSDKMVGKGGLDFFMTVKTGSDWSRPVPLDFINTEKDDRFISIPAKGRYAFVSQYSGRNFHIVQRLIPREWRPKNVMRLSGKVVDGVTGEPVDAMLTVFDTDTRKRVWNNTIGTKGAFAMVLKEGGHYDLSFTHPSDNYKYFAKFYSLDSIGRKDKEVLRVMLLPLEPGREYESPVIFREHSSEIDNVSAYELRRLTAMLRKNAGMRVEINVSQTNYREDSVQSDPDLTERVIDTTYADYRVPGRNTDGTDGNTSAYSSPDLSKLVITEIYHNDRTEAQAGNIKAYLAEKGIAGQRITTATHSMKRPPGYDELQGTQGEFRDVYVTIKVIGL